MLSDSVKEFLEYKPDLDKGLIYINVNSFVEIQKAFEDALKLESVAKEYHDIIVRIRKLAEQLAKTDWRGHPPVEHQISKKIIEILEGEQ